MSYALAQMLEASATRIRELEAAQATLVAEVSKWAASAGEARGKLEASELAGIVEGWQVRARKAEAELLTLKAERDDINRIATNGAYMIAALTQMLGPKGREVRAMWKAKGVQRIHTDWGPAASGLTGEEIAQLHLDMEDAIKRSCSIENIDVPRQAPGADHDE